MDERAREDDAGMGRVPSEVREQEEGQESWAHSVDCKDQHRSIRREELSREGEL